MHIFYLLQTQLKAPARSSTACAEPCPVTEPSTGLQCWDIQHVSTQSHFQGTVTPCCVVFGTYSVHIYSSMCSQGPEELSFLLCAASTFSSAPQWHMSSRCRKMAPVEFSWAAYRRLPPARDNVIYTG